MGYNFAVVCMVQQGDSLLGMGFIMLHIKCQANCKWMQQPPTLLDQQCVELLCPCWQWCAKGCNNS